MTKNPSLAGGHGPTLRALDPWLPSGGRMHQLLSDDERARLAVMSSVARFRKGEIIYRENDSAEAIYNINSGVVAAYRQAPDGREHIVAFLLPDDIFGLSAEGRYANTTKAITDVAAYRLPLAALRNRLSKDAELEFHVICKLCQELRQAQRHAFLLSEKRAVTRLAMFLQLIEQSQNARGEQTAELYLPMDRSAIAEYIGVTLAATSRAFRKLSEDGIVKFRNRVHLRIVDRERFDKLAGDPPARWAAGLPR